MSPEWTSLMPHEMDKWAILVKSETKLNVRLNLRIALFLPILLMICSFFRKIFRSITKSPHCNWSHVALDTLGLFLSTNTSFRVYNLSERIMNVYILLISILTSKFITAVLVIYMLAIETDTGIDTLKQLDELDIPIYVSDEMQMTMNEWSQNIP